MASGAVVGFNSRMEQASIAFKTMLGSGEKARAFLGELERERLHKFDGSCGLRYLFSLSCPLVEASGINANGFIVSREVTALLRHVAITLLHDLMEVRGKIDNGNFRALPLS